MKKGKIIIISGPSGSGKTTLSQKLLASRKFKRKLAKSISATTRPKRQGERSGRDYLFMSREKFLYKRKAGHFLESENVFGNYYGTPKKNVQEMQKKGKSVLLCIDVKGAKSVVRQHKEAVTIFIKTPSMAILRKRLTKRGSESKADLTRRLKTARKELKEARKYKYTIINDNVNTAYFKLDKILHKELEMA